MSATRYRFINADCLQAEMIEHQDGEYIATPDYLAACRDAVAMGQGLSDVLGERMEVPMSVERIAFLPMTHEAVLEINRGIAKRNQRRADIQRVLAAYGEEQ
jgi:hypothetical protein